MSDSDWVQFVSHARDHGIDLGPFEQMIRSASVEKRNEVGALALRLLSQGAAVDEVVMASIDCILTGPMR